MAALGAEARAALLGRRGDPEAAAAGLAAALGLGAYRTAPREAAVVDLYVQAAECAHVSSVRHLVANVVHNPRTP